jgi:methylated-DNA-[protein]-cysteine S-methyltransferase
MCGLAWSERGVVLVQLPEADARATEARLRRGGARPANPNGGIESMIAEIQRYLSGQRVDFAAAVLDLSAVGQFERRVYAATRGLVWGETASYGEIARRIDDPGAARAVGQALGRNPIPIIIPCHRVLASGNRMGGFSAPGGTFTKERLLALEHAGPRAREPMFPGI